MNTKIKLRRKVPLAPNMRFGSAMQYAAFYRYLEHYNFGPYYIDDVVLPENIRLLNVRIMNADSPDTAKWDTKIQEYRKRWFTPLLYPDDATFFLWATYEIKTIDDHGTIKWTAQEDGFNDLLQGRSLELCYYLESEKAQRLLDHFSYLINACVLTPGYYIIAAIEIVKIDELKETDAEMYRTAKKNRELATRGDRALVATIYNEVDEEGIPANSKRVLLIELLNEYMVQMTNKRDE